MTDGSVDAKEGKPDALKGHPRDSGKDSAKEGKDSGKEHKDAETDGSIGDGGAPTDGSSDAEESKDSGAHDAKVHDASDAGPALFAHGGLSIASGGDVSSSTHFTLIATVGQSPGGNVTSQSTKFRLNGGLVGATQKP